LTIYIPEPITILLIVLSFLAGFLYKKYRDNEDVADAFDEGFEKGAEAAINTVSRDDPHDDVSHWIGRI